MKWQQRLYDERFVNGALPSAISIPTGLGKTAVMAIWLLALAKQMRSSRAILPRRLIYVVDRRAVVDQATKFAEGLRMNLGKPEAAEIATALGLDEGKLMPISTLRGQFVDNHDWLADPSCPAIIVCTVDMIGSRLLFEGYGVSRKMRPYHAGLLGADALVLLDEAHLVPPFEALLAEIAENPKRYGAGDDALNTLVPRFQLLPLSATGRRQTNNPFVLKEKDFRDDATIIDVEAHKRLCAKKRLILQELDNDKLEDALANQAWAMVQDTQEPTEGESAGTTLKPVRVIVYCNSRDVAEKVETSLNDKAKKAGVKDRTELLVGARRVKERINAEQRLRELGFLAQSGKQTAPAFFVATSAGEVGVDLDADHMVCDLVVWERMVQRLGRVNRRGGEERQAEIVVLLEPPPKPKKAAKDALEKPDGTRTDKDNKAIESYKKAVEAAQAEQQKRQAPFGKALPKREDDSFDVGPEALRQLAERATTDETLAKLIVKASTPVPLRPALNRALVDAWSMTSLPEHTGRPDVAPWLRGWVDDKPQTTVAWRKHLPVCEDINDYDKLTKKEIKEIEGFFEAAPLHASEKLETESWRVFGWLKKRAAMTEKTPDADKVLATDAVVAMLLKPDGSLLRSLRLRDLLGDPKNKDDKNRLDAIESDIKGKTIVVDTAFGGLNGGLLNADVGDTPPAADDGNAWMPSDDSKPVIRFRVREHSEGNDNDEAAEADWRENRRFDLERNADGDATRWLAVQKWRDTSNTEDDRAEGRPQALKEHQSWAAEKAKSIGQRLRLPDEYVCALSTAARLHDEGKKAQRWQRAFRAERDAKKLGIKEPLAKTRGPINQQVLGGYRHEFGSLPYAKDDADFQKLSQDMQDLVLHLIAAHHGFARPLIAIKGCDDTPPSALEDRAREVALRYAHLQKRWGPWGLAWWEALLRAADVQASRANDERDG